MANSVQLNLPPQTATVMRPVELRMPFVEALARWAGASVETTIRFDERRTA